MDLIVETFGLSSEDSAWLVEVFNRGVALLTFIEVSWVINAAGRAAEAAAAGVRVNSG